MPPILPRGMSLHLYMLPIPYVIAVERTDDNLFGVKWDANLTSCAFIAGERTDENLFSDR